MRTGSTLAITATVLLLLARAAGGDGPGAYPQPKPGAAPVSEQKAIDAYNAGYALIQRADHADNLAAAASNAAERDEAHHQSQELYRESLPHFAEAVRYDASMHEALTYSGYANRKLGRHEDALRAYGEALRINPSYPYAIEYQAQAFLALNRIDEARFNYLRLYALSPRAAGKLLRAMDGWLDANQASPPAGVDMQAFAAWVKERKAATANEPLADAAGSW